MANPFRDMSVMMQAAGGALAIRDPGAGGTVPSVFSGGPGTSRLRQGGAGSNEIKPGSHTVTGIQATLRGIEAADGCVEQATGHPEDDRAGRKGSGRVYPPGAGSGERIERATAKTDGGEDRHARNITTRCRLKRRRMAHTSTYWISSAVEPAFANHQRRRSAVGRSWAPVRRRARNIRFVRALRLVEFSRLRPILRSRLIRLRLPQVRRRRRGESWSASEKP